MKLRNLEAYVPAVLYSRGLDYFERDFVEELTEDAPNRWYGLVAGTNYYDVTINLAGDETILSSSCTCPFESDSLCKHEVAVCLAILEHKEKNPFGAIDVLPKLKEMEKAELLETLEDLLQKQPAVNQYLTEKFSEPVEMNENVARRLIRKSANRAKRSGFIEWDRTDRAVEGARKVQKYLSSLIPEEAGELMIRLHLIVIQECTELLQVADDSSGMIGSIIYESLAEIDEAMEVWPEELDDTKVDEMLELLYLHILYGLEQDITEAATELMASVLGWSERGDYADKIFDFIDKVIASDEMQNMAHRYDEEQFRIYQLAILQQQKDKEAVDAFIQKYWRYSAIRRTEIIRALIGGEFEKMARLCKESEQLDSEFPELVKGWKELRFEAYKGMGSTAGMIELAYAFAVEGDETYYGKLKDLVEAERWSEMLDRLLEEMKTEMRSQPLYVAILIEERMSEDLLEYCRSNVHEIETLYTYLLDDHPEEVNEIFTMDIYRAIESASNRKAYYTVCGKIRTFQEAMGAQAAERLIEEIKFMYPKRKALLEELSKI